MTTLRQALVKLASDKPELREHLTPLLKTANTDVLHRPLDFYKTIRQLQKMDPDQLLVITDKLWPEVEGDFDRKSNFSVGGLVFLGKLRFKSLGWGSRNGMGYLTLRFQGWS